MSGGCWQVWWHDENMSTHLLTVDGYRTKREAEKAAKSAGIKNPIFFKQREIIFQKRVA